LLNPEGADSTSAGAAETTTTTLTLRSWPAAQISFSLSLSRPFEIFFSVTSSCSYFTLDNRTLIWRSESAFLFKEKSEAWRGGGTVIEKNDSWGCFIDFLNI
jgi:hypothetical protein